MRRYRASLYLALAFAALVYSASNVRADVCNVMLSVHPHAWILLHHAKLTQCVSGAAGCKCVSCWNWAGAPYSVCYPLWAPIPH